MNCIALIPAKGRSTRLPNKNLLPCAGVPLITRAIRCAKEAGIFGQVVVSTDSPAIAAIAADEHARVLWRPKVLCADGVEWAAVVSHFLAALNYDMDAFAVLPPTTPTRTAEHLRLVYKYFLEYGDMMTTIGRNARCDGSVVFCEPIDFLRRLSFPWLDGGTYGTQDSMDINTAEDLAKAEAICSAH